jgi:hypothetical protein
MEFGSTSISNPGVIRAVFLDGTLYVHRQSSRMESQQSWSQRRTIYNGVVPTGIPSYRRSAARFPLIMRTAQSLLAIIEW